MRMTEKSMLKKNKKCGCKESRSASISWDTVASQAPKHVFRSKPETSDFFFFFFMARNATCHMGGLSLCRYLRHDAEDLVDFSHPAVTRGAREFRCEPLSVAFTLWTTLQTTQTDSEYT